MNNDRFPLAPSREPNPLRPYYIPPTIGSTPTAHASTSPPSNTQRATASNPSFSTSARDYLPELDIDLRSTTGEAWRHTRTILDTLVWRYTSILLAQPFDVAKTVLQVSLPPSAGSQAQVAGAKKKRRSSRSRQSARSSRKHARSYSDASTSDQVGEEQGGESSDASDDVQDYFTSAAPRSRSPRRRKRTPPSGSLSTSRTPTPKDRREQDIYSDYRLRLKKADSITHAISALYNTCGAVGLWRGTNATFLYSILLRTTDSFVRSLLLAIAGLPDISGPDPSGLGPSLSVTGAGFSGLDVFASPNPMGSLVIAAAASGITGLLLAPLDLIRTRLIVTPISHAPRGLLQNLHHLPSVLVPAALWLPTTLYHTLPQLFSGASPLLMRRQLNLTPELTPNLWSIAAFATSLTDLFLRLPLETLVRRAQVSSLLRAEPEMPTIIDTAPYVGVWGTVYSILYTEGEGTVVGGNAKTLGRVKRGQGAWGLVRGWRVGFWGLVGVWAGGALGPGESKARGEF